MVVHLNIGLRSIHRDSLYFAGFFFLGDKLIGIVLQVAFVLPLWKEGRLAKSLLALELSKDFQIENTQQT